MRTNRRPIAIMRRSCSDSLLTASQSDGVFGSDRPAPHWPGDVGQHACLENLEHDVTSCFVATRCGSPAPDMVALEAMQALSRIGEPRATANVAIAARIAIGKKIEAGPSLIAEIGRHGISVLFPEGDIRHRQRKRPPLQVADKPMWPRQRACDSGQQRSIL